MTDGVMSGVICPNDSDHGQMVTRDGDRVCVIEECGYSEPHSDIHDADTKEIDLVARDEHGNQLICEIISCKKPLSKGNIKTIIVRGQKLKVCGECEDGYHKYLHAANMKGDSDGSQE